MDSFVVQSGFDVQAFIRRVQGDTTFYKAFKSLHFIPYKAVNDIRCFDKDGNVSATLYSHTSQTINGKCRQTFVAEEKVTGDMYKKNGSYYYYTAQLYDNLFFARKPVCNESDIVAGSLDIAGKSRVEKNIQDLKQLIFNPGSKVGGIPFTGRRASVFDEDEAGKYDFRIAVENKDGTPCYVFRILPKKEYASNVIYNELTTWFRKTDYSIVARDYSLSYHTLFYDFDVTMRVRTTQIGGKLYPVYISYDGNWHIISRKRERVKFVMDVIY